MNLLLNAIYAFIATMCFSILFRCPKRAIPYAGCCGMLAWVVYFLVFSVYGSAVGATFMGALATSFSSQLLARVKKMPITITLLPGIIPLVPGAGMYFTMISLLQGDYNQAIFKGTETLLIATAIAAAVIIAASIYTLFNTIIRKLER
ncbi:MAG TPA: threonine/serine exporter [Clostridiales bacterium]|nr:threonine/serine exporter [Clostridiales bacterium]